MIKEEILIPTLLMAAAVIALFENAEGSDSIKAKARERILSRADSSGVRARLSYLGLEGQYEIFRLKQFTMTLGTGAFSFLFGLGLMRKVGMACLFSFVFSLLTYLFADRRLTTQVRQNRLIMESEFASIVEMLALSLSAGETPLAAIDRVSRRSDSRFARELSKVVAQVKSGTPFQSALDEMGRKLDSVPIRRFVDALITAMTRGAPIIDVLHRHSAEARQIQRNIVMERAGKAEISLMIPVVFLILPVSVLFALWPSFTHLNLFA